MRIGIDLGGTKIEGVVLDHDGHELQRKRKDTRQSEGYQAILHTVEQLVGDLEVEIGRKCSIGIGTPGTISAVTGTMKNSNTVCLNGRPLLEDLRTLLHRPLRIAQLFPLKHRHKENKAIQRSLKISFRELLTKLQYYGSIN